MDTITASKIQPGMTIRVNPKNRRMFNLNEWHVIGQVERIGNSVNLYRPDGTRFEDSLSPTSKVEVQ